MSRLIPLRTLPSRKCATTWLLIRDPPSTHHAHGDHRHFIASPGDCQHRHQTWDESRRREPAFAGAVPGGSVPLEELDRLLVLFGGGSRVERAEVSSLPRLGIFLAGIEPVLPRLQLSNHFTPARGILGAVFDL